MDEFYLNREFMSVKKGSSASYGGNQVRSGSSVIRRCGCGVIGALDLILYLNGRYHITHEEYDRLCVELSRKYLPLIPPLGINGAAVACGLELYFTRNHMPFKAAWQVTGKNIFDKISAMLNDDIPVIMSIGQNFPRVWQKEKLPLYSIGANGDFIKTASVKAHFVTVTGMDDDWLQISSWGRKYYINKREYISYIKEHSSSFITNVLLVERRRNGNDHKS